MFIVINTFLNLHFYLLEYAVWHLEFTGKLFMGLLPSEWVKIVIK